MSEHKKVISLSLIILNILSAVFYAVYVITGIQNHLTNIAAGITFVLLIADLIYAGLCKTKVSIAQIILSAFLFIINFASNYIIGLSAYTLDKNYIGIISIILLFLMNALFIFIDLKKANKPIELNKIVSIIIFTAGILFLFSIIIVGLISLFAHTPINTNTVNLSLLFIVLSISVCALTLIVSGGFKSKKIKYLACLTAAIAVIPLAILQFGVADDSKQADTNLNQIFPNIESAEDMRAVPYSFADEFVGIETDDFVIKRDIVYYSSSSGADSGLNLKYDMYLPTDETACKSVLVNLHGSGGDKDIGNYAHRNKYFASRGYVVFDLQYGDWNESNTGFNENMYSHSSESFLFYIDKFFEYLSENNDSGADLSSVFITGVSMGGSLTSKYAYSYDNHLDDYGITLKGIIPVYPAYRPDDDGIDNYLNYVDANSVPTMVVMGTSDCIVRPQALGETVDAFSNAGNPNCFPLEISYAGHGSDSLMTGRFNQLFIYYTERFMAELR